MTMEITRRYNLNLPSQHANDFDVLCMWTVSSYIHKTRLGGRAMYFKVYENTSTLLDVTLMMYIVIFISTIFLILLN